MAVRQVPLIIMPKLSVPKQDLEVKLATVRFPVVVALVRMEEEALRLVKVAVVAFMVVPEKSVTPKTLELRLMALPEAVVLVPLARLKMGLEVETTCPVELTAKSVPVSPVKAKLVVVAEVKTEVEELLNPDVHWFQLPP